MIATAENQKLTNLVSPSRSYWSALLTCPKVLMNCDSFTILSQTQNIVQPVSLSSEMTICKIFIY